MAKTAVPEILSLLSKEEEEKLKELWSAIGPLIKDDASHTEVPNQDGAEIAAPVPSIHITNSTPADGEEDTDSDSATSAPSRTHTSSSSAKTSIDTSDNSSKAATSQSEAAALPTPDSTRAHFWKLVKHEDPDMVLVRFLRARKWHVKNALAMLTAAVAWRSEEVRVDDDIMRNGEEGALKATRSADPAARKLGEDFLAQMRMGKSFMHGCDKEGRSICLIRARLHKPGAQSTESLERFQVFLTELGRIVSVAPNNTVCLIFDLGGFSMANMDYAPIKLLIKCFEGNYPESLGIVHVYRAPWIVNGIWRIIRGWLDPVVAKKVKFVGSVKELEEYIPRKQIIAELGGDEQWTYEYLEPVEGENDRMQDTKRRTELEAAHYALIQAYEKNTAEWINSRTSLPTELKARRKTLAARLGESYWQLDPYIRARTHYDRAGILNAGGKVNFYP
ncbi:hypothetical protein BP6252_11203 [Coleophoma cylindrospora]|uniref:CRAL-TRIO domain-containing protein n=1 Tax=Coleophoma cylindrospora TaxID=1849047 RepID=A0A3D8QPP9_9HELO|nr:hypothetical protein BP6252_11203 [Coleophoma cylindrospora]